MTPVRRDAFARIVGVVTRRPLIVLAITALLALGGAGLALRLEPSAATDTLVDRGSESFQATERFKQDFGDEAGPVLLRRGPACGATCPTRRGGSAPSRRSAARSPS